MVDVLPFPSATRAPNGEQIGEKHNGSLAHIKPFPRYHDLFQPVPGYKASWDYFNSLHGSRDELGTLNFLSAERRLSAVRNEVVDGKTISLDLPLNTFARDSAAFGGREPVAHILKRVAPFAMEDEITMNTQCSSQWDGLRHAAIQNPVTYYNNFTQEDFLSGDCLGVHRWSERGGVQGRGVLVDFAGWRTAVGRPCDPNEGYAITLSDIQATLEHQNTHIQAGDVLVVHIGWVEWYLREDPGKRHVHMCCDNSPGEHTFTGLLPAYDLMEWLWQNQIAAIASDSVALEVTPPDPNKIGWLHEHLLAGLGMPIGELFNTGPLAVHCRETSRYTFYLSSNPLYLVGGVATPSNAIAMM